MTDIKTNHISPDDDERNRILFKKIPLPAYVWKKEADDFVLFDYNDAANKFTRGGIRDQIGRLLSDVYHDNPEPYRDVRKCYSERLSFTKEMRYQFHSIDIIRDLIVTYVFVPPDMVLVFANDITEQKKMRHDLEEREEMFRALLEGISEAVVAIDRKGRIQFVNSSAVRMFGYSKDELEEKTVEILVPEALKDSHCHHREDYFKEPVTRNMGRGQYLEGLRKDGTVFPVEIGLNTVDVGDDVYVISLVTDITDRRRAEKLLERAARTDMLTGLANRREFNVRFDMEISRFTRTNRPFSVVLTDIDHFKNINDTYGHECGDDVLKVVADVMNKSIRKQDLVGRWGGEEFIVLLPETDRVNASKLAEKLRKAIESHEMQYRGMQFSITMSFGVAVYDGGCERDEVVRRADNRLYKAKQSGRNRVVDS